MKFVQGDYHEGGNRRHLLATHWSSLRNVLRFQPLDHISDYFGVKVALYFAWLGFYTHMLCVASLVGVIVFIIGAATYSWNVPGLDESAIYAVK
jgi:anoctamin-1